MKILVSDGQGGRLGRKLLESIRKACPEVEISAVGTNSIATENMMNSGCADNLATGENAVIVACRSAQISVGPFGIATADAMMGEISAEVARDQKRWGHSAKWMDQVLDGMKEFAENRESEILFDMQEFFALGEFVNGRVQHR